MLSIHENTESRRAIDADTDITTHDAHDRRREDRPLTTLWKMPFLSGALAHDPSCVVSGDRVILELTAENEYDQIVSVRLIFDGVQVFRRTADPAKTLAMIEVAYNEVVDRGDTPWLREVTAETKARRRGQPLRDLIICFDEAPCYEFVCTSFSLEDR